MSYLLKAGPASGNICRNAGHSPNQHSTALQMSRHSLRTTLLKTGSSTFFIFPSLCSPFSAFMGEKVGARVPLLAFWFHIMQRNTDARGSTPSPAMSTADDLNMG